MVETSLIASAELFAGLDDADIAPIAAAAHTRQLRRGDVLFLETDEPNELFIVVSGRIAISNRSVDGRESVVALMEPGDLFGEMGLFDSHGRSAGARALEPAPKRIGRRHRRPVRSPGRAVAPDVCGT